MHLLLAQLSFICSTIYAMVCATQSCLLLRYRLCPEQAYSVNELADIKFAWQASIGNASFFDVLNSVTMINDAIPYSSVYQAVFHLTYEQVCTWRAIVCCNHCTGSVDITSTACAHTGSQSTASDIIYQ